MDSRTPNMTASSYKMSEDDVRRLIEFRASNELLFNGKRNSAKKAWSTILTGLDLQGKLTPEQIAKKWDNLRTKYKDLKQPYQSTGWDHAGGAAESWPWFRLMDDAMHGRLYNSHMVLSALDDSRRRDDDDILEFLIKTEMDDSVAAESTDEDGSGAEPVEPPDGLPVGRRRMSESSYKSSTNQPAHLIPLVICCDDVTALQRNDITAPFFFRCAGSVGSGDGASHQGPRLQRGHLYRQEELGQAGVEGRASRAGPSGQDEHRATGQEVGQPEEEVQGAEVPPARHGVQPGLVAVVPPHERRRRGPPSRRRARPGARRRRRRGRRLRNVDPGAEEASPQESRRHGRVLHRVGDRHARRRPGQKRFFGFGRTPARRVRLKLQTGIVKEMGLTGKITPDQVAKKWDNLKTKFKDLKFPPRGAEPQSGAASWPWFQLMSDALEGRLAGKGGAQVAPVWSAEDDTVSGSAAAATAEVAACEVDRTQKVADLGLSDANVTYIDASGEECAAPTELSYKLSDQDTRRLITLRAANEVLFTGRRNAAKAAWKSIIQQLDLQGKVSTSQVAKKWDNLKRRFKDLKYPPAGMENVTESAASWPWFHLMNDAMEGRLVCGGAPLPGHVDRDGETVPGPPVGDGGNQAALEREWAAVRAQREWLERERAELEKERSLLEQDRAALERERDLLDQRALMLATDSHSTHIGSIM
ncbi:uncharacterized protein LOC127597269 isoform X1 [Hippocampus zosterae]|uniref:uncharacterized protein LOC127597269 isoform X1 n=1 Tax=Hippocampus zosterae TaxID=109293 RepID=UPI00223D90DB|nr:uncharacterized protein LOC127597269 isoform X1 [Hippocampus zosterae]